MLHEIEKHDLYSRVRLSNTKLHIRPPEHFVEYRMKHVMSVVLTAYFPSCRKN